MAQQLKLAIFGGKKANSSNVLEHFRFKYVNKVFKPYVF